jgi:hypothetical protein
MPLFFACAALAGSVFAARPEERDCSFQPNPEIQLWLKRVFADDPEERKLLFSEEEVKACKTEEDGKTLFREKIARLAEQAGGPERFVGELLYIGSRATDVQEGMLPVVIVHQWDIAPDAIADALKPYLASEDKRMAAEAAELLEGVEWWKREYGDRFKRMFETPED